MRSARNRSALRDLELITRATVEGLRHGLHRSPFHGYSAEFSQYRHYQPGDELKYVDWKAYARSDRLYSRQFRETTNLGALFVLDTSRSMAFPDHDSKFDLARATTAVLATLVIDQGDSAGLLAVADARDGPSHYLPPRSGRHHLRQLLAVLSRAEPEVRSSIGTALRRAGTLMRRIGMVVVISDFYDESDTIAEMTRLSHMGHDVIAIQVVACEEWTLPVKGAAQFEDLETGVTVVTDATAIARGYERAFAEFVARIERAARREGLDYVRLNTGEPLEPALRRFLIRRRPSTT